MPTSPIGKRYDLRYADHLGVVTDRVIQIEDVWLFEQGVLVLQAHCFLRDEERHFRVDRILSLRERGGGDRVDPRHFRAFAKGARRQGLDMVDAGTPAYSTSWIGEAERTAIRKVAPGLKVLLWIARAAKDEAVADAAIGAYVAARIKTDVEGLDRDLLDGWVRSLRPTFADAAGALTKMPRRGAELPLVRGMARDLAAGSAACGKRLMQLRALMEE